MTDTMTITLTPDQEAGLAALVAAGNFASVEEAARVLLDERLAERQIENDDFAWAKPLIDQAETDIARGNVLTLEEHRARMTARLAALRG
jgi:antitoxin ParD1/3/4